MWLITGIGFETRKRIQNVRWTLRQGGTRNGHLCEENLPCRGYDGGGPSEGSREGAKTTGEWTKILVTPVK